MDKITINTAITMQDVADAAGVSTATVSRTLMRPEKVSILTRQKVEAAIQRVGYQLPSALQHTKKKPSHLLLIITSNTEQSIIHEMIHGIEHITIPAGYTTLLNYSIDPKQPLFNWIMQKHVDGIIVLDNHFQSLLTDDTLKYFPPIVMANEFTSALNIPTVHIDNLTAAFNAVTYLHQLGHRRIACICGPQHLSFSQYRKQGYIQALHRNGIAIEYSYIIEGHLTFESGVNSFNLLMQLPQPPTAIFCHSDILAIGALFEAKKKGLRIPQDLSLIGFNNIPMSEYCDPPLTTIAQPYFQIGKQAATLLLQTLQEKLVKNNAILLDSELLIRQTTTAPSTGQKHFG